MVLTFSRKLNKKSFVRRLFSAWEKWLDTRKQNHIFLGGGGRGGGEGESAQETRNFCRCCTDDDKSSFTSLLLLLLCLDVSEVITLLSSPVQANKQEVLFFLGNTTCTRYVRNSCAHCTVHYMHTKGLKLQKSTKLLRKKKKIPRIK